MKSIVFCVLHILLHVVTSTYTLSPCFVRPGHTCDFACIIIAIVQYETVPDLAARAYDKVTAMTTAGLGKRFCFC